MGLLLLFCSAKKSNISDKQSNRNPKKELSVSCTCDFFYRKVKKDCKEMKEVDEVKSVEMMEEHVGVETIGKIAEVKNVKSPDPLNPVGGGAVTEPPVELPALAACSSITKSLGNSSRRWISSANSISAMSPRVGSKDDLPSENLVSGTAVTLPAVSPPTAAGSPIRGITQKVLTTEKQPPVAPKYTDNNEIKKQRSACMASSSATGDGEEEEAHAAVREIPRTVTMREKSSAPESNSMLTRGSSKIRDKTSCLAPEEGEYRPPQVVSRPAPASVITMKDVRAPRNPPLVSVRGGPKQSMSSGAPSRGDNSNGPPQPPPSSATEYASPPEKYCTNHPSPLMSCQDYPQSYPGDRTQSSLGYLVCPSPPSPYHPTFLEAFSDDNANNCSVM